MNPYLQLLWAQKTRFAGLAVFCLSWLPAMERGGVTWANRAAAAFCLLTLYSLIIGWALASLLHEALHRPHALLLPRGAARLFNAHLAVTALVALAAGFIAHAVSPALAVFPAAAWAALLLACTLLLGPGVSSGDDTAVVTPLRNGLLLGLAIGSVSAPAMFIGWMQGAPVAWSAVSLAAATVLLTLPRSRARLRTRALTPHVPYFSALFYGPLMKRRASQNEVRQHFERLTLTSRWHLRSLGWWLAALRFERRPDGGRFGRVPGLVISSLVAVAILSVAAGKPGGLLPGARDFISGPSLWSLLGVLLLFQTHVVAVPRARCLYPLSRRTRANALFLGALADLAFAYVILVGVVFLFGQSACLINGRAFPWQGFWGIAAMIATALPVAPLVHWGRLGEESRDSRIMQIAVLGCSFILVPLLSRTLWMARNYDPLANAAPGENVLFFLALFVVTQAAFFAALRHYYRKRDLIQRVSADTIGSFAWMKWLVTTSAATNAGLRTDTRR